MAEEGHVESQIKMLKNKRRSLKSNLTRFIKFINDQTNEDKVVEISDRINKIEKIIDDFNKTQEAIEFIDQTECESNEMSEFEDRYFSIMATAKEIVNKNETMGKTASNELPANMPTAARSTTQTNYQLPTISLPQFDGAYEKWSTFIDMFKSLVHNNPNLSRVQKFHYLKTSLRSEALKVVASLEVNEINYDIALNLLTSRFENKKMMVNRHIKCIFDIPPVLRESHQALRAFLDTFQEHYRCLINLGDSIGQTSSILIYLVLSKLDNATRKEWQIKTKDVTFPQINALLEFLNDRCLMLESIQININKGMPAKSVNLSINKFFCVICKNNDHGIAYCGQFVEKDSQERLRVARQLALCINCLRKGHSSANCRAKPCNHCGRKHHTLLHLNSIKQSSKEKPDGSQSQLNIRPISVNNADNQSASPQSIEGDFGNSLEKSVSANCSRRQSNGYTFLSTAIVKVHDAQGQVVTCRALLDNASQSNFMSEELHFKLGYCARKVNIPIMGINAITSVVNRAVKTRIYSRVSDESFDVNFLVIANITEDLPQRSIDTRSFPIPSEVKLADPDFFKSSKIDLLLGVDIFYEVLLTKKIQLGKYLPILKSTKLGYIVAGNVSNESLLRSSVCNVARVVELQELHDKLEEFWKVEECLENSNVYSSEEQQCEDHFAQTYIRDSNGKFIVELPFKTINVDFGNSLLLAQTRFQSLERSFVKNAELKAQYKIFMQEYKELGHMSLIANPVCSEFNYYLPHHSVLKSSSSTTKLRVVFNASAKPRAGISLNDILKKGPTIQPPLFYTLLRFRTKLIAFTADISKMYRCILVKESQRDYQRVLWRASPSDKMEHFRLNTLTYGTASASFLATRCLKQLSLDNEGMFSLAARSIAEDFYMDDWLAGADDVQSAMLLIEQVNSILASAHFNLRQWSSNNSMVLKFLEQLSTTAIKQYFVNDPYNNKTLGIYWNSLSDEFRYEVNLPSQHNEFTKRSIMSVIGSIYDILGLLSPVIIKAKMIVQQLWLSKVGWDDPIPSDILKSWLMIYDQLQELNNVRIPRLIKGAPVKSIQVHCFCDASTVGYGAAVYIRSEMQDSSVKNHLLCSKSKVAPLKTLSLPRLELCGALLAAKLCKSALSAIQFEIDHVYFWTDSQIVLAWLAREPSTLKTFVANRVSKIQRITRINNWRYVPSLENPADFVSRGLYPMEIINNKFWFYGPSFLEREVDMWPSSSNVPSIEIEGELPDIKLNVFMAYNKSDTEWIVGRYSSYNKLLRVVAYMLRFKNNVSNAKDGRRVGPLTVIEMDEALILIAKLVQLECFSAEISKLLGGKSISSKSSLAPLNPIIDKTGLLRVGGRLENSMLSYSAKHPIILPAKHQFTALIIMHEHHGNLHAGTRLILSMIRRRFWPLQGRRTVRSVLTKCLTCFRVSPTKIIQKMANLPSHRVRPNTRAFVVCGVDYAGPFNIKDSKLRNKKIIKGYICIFVCFNTKAVHIEAVTDLSAESFLNVLKRFVGRRGLCSDIYSDCGTNFVGSCNLLSDMINKTNDINLRNYLLANQITWHFSPPRSPHFGGLWESAVRSAKFHLERVMRNATFTYEDFYTICVQIESILNSRPLCPISEELEDYETITPGHFLIGSCLKAIPELPVWDERITFVKRYKHMQFVMQQFWTQWSRDYLHTLQERSKWRVQRSVPIKVGSLVLLHDENSPPMYWKLGRIIENHPGKDGIVRVVSIQTKSSICKRSVTKISLLPIELDTHEDVESV